MSPQTSDVTPEEMLKRGYTRETNLWRNDRGQWFDGETPLKQPRLERAFSSWLNRTSDGRHCLKNSIHWVYVRIEGPAFWVESTRALDGAIELSLTSGVTEVLDPHTLRVDSDGVLYCSVRNGAEAKFRNHAAVALSEFFEPKGDALFFTHGSTHVKIAGTEGMS